MEYIYYVWTCYFESKSVRKCFVIYLKTELGSTQHCETKLTELNDFNSNAIALRARDRKINIRGCDVMPNELINADSCDNVHIYICDMTNFSIALDLCLTTKEKIMIKHAFSSQNQLDGLQGNQIEYLCLSILFHGLAFVRIQGHFFSKYFVDTTWIQFIWHVSLFAQQYTG